MVLKNSTPEVPTNNKNNLVFKQIQTTDYSLQKIQKNVQALSSDITTALNRMNAVIATQPKSQSYLLTIATTPLTINFPKTVTNSTKSYDEVTSVFTAANEGVYTCTLNGSFNVVAGSPTVIYIYFNSDVQGTLSKSQSPVINNVAYFNLTFVIRLTNNEHLNFLVSSNVTTTNLMLSADSRISYNSIG
jgi:hypothetical protein